MTSFAATGWVEESGEWYCYDKDGDNYYYVDSTGKMAANTWVKVILSAVASYRVTGNNDSLRRAMHAANLLAGRFNVKGGFIRAWNDGAGFNQADVTGWMIVDCLMNIHILYWAGEVSGDPRYAEIANRHADTAMKYLMRPDGSCNHIASFNPATGEFIEAIPGQGYGEGSAWSRGQGWALYGFSAAYRHTGNEQYLNTAKRCAHFCISCLAASDWLPLFDFRAPEQFHNTIY